MTYKNIIIILLLLLLLFILYKYNKNSEHFASPSLEAIQNISSVYADKQNTAYFNNLSIQNNLQTNSLKTNSLQVSDDMDISGNIDISGNVNINGNGGTIKISTVNTETLINNSAAQVLPKNQLIDVKSVLHFNGAGFRRWTIPMNSTNMANGGTGSLQIKDPNGWTYGIDNWVIFMSGIYTAGSTVQIIQINPFVNSQDNTWWMAYTFPVSNPDWDATSVDVLAIPISLFEIVWNNQAVAGNTNPSWIIPSTPNYNATVKT
jgi:hypothetical protein